MGRDDAISLLFSSSQYPRIVCARELGVAVFSPPDAPTLAAEIGYEQKMDKHGARAAAPPPPGRLIRRRLPFDGGDVKLL